MDNNIDIDNTSLKKTDDIYEIYEYDTYDTDNPKYYALGIKNNDDLLQIIGSLGYYVKAVILPEHNSKYNSCLSNLNEKCNSINMRSDCATNLTEIENDNGGNENE